MIRERMDTPVIILRLIEAQDLLFSASMRLTLLHSFSKARF